MVFFPSLEYAFAPIKAQLVTLATGGLRWRKHDRARRDSAQRFSIWLHCRLSSHRWNGTHHSAHPRATRNALKPYAISIGLRKGLQRAGIDLDSN
jgi:hypothetical protein